MNAVKLDTVPVGAFVGLAGGRAHEGLNDEQFRTLLLAVMDREHGASAAAHMIGMRVFGRRSEKLAVSEEFKATGREFLARAPFLKRVQLDHLIGDVIKVSFDKPEHEEQARAFCARLIEALNTYEVYGSDLGDTVSALTKTFPLVVLDLLVEQSVGGHRTGR